MRLVLCLLLVFSAVPSWAGWVKMAEIAFHIDSDTMRINGNVRRVSELQDLKTKDTGGELSRRLLVEYDCKEGRRRLLSLTTYAGPMATGNVLVNLNKASAWDYISDGATASSTLKFVCAWKS